MAMPATAHVIQNASHSSDSSGGIGAVASARAPPAAQREELARTR